MKTRTIDLNALVMEMPKKERMAFVLDLLYEVDKDAFHNIHVTMEYQIEQLTQALPRVALKDRQPIEREIQKMEKVVSYFKYWYEQED